MCVLNMQLCVCVCAAYTAMGGCVCAAYTAVTMQHQHVKVLEYSEVMYVFSLSANSADTFTVLKKI